MKFVKETQAKTKYKFDNRLEWGLKQNNKFKQVKRIEI